MFFLQNVQATIPSPQLTQTLNIAQPRELAKSMLYSWRAGPVKIPIPLCANGNPNHGKLNHNIIPK